MSEYPAYQKRLSVCILGFASLTLVLVALSFQRGVTVMQHYVCPLAFAFAGMTLFSGRYGKQIDLWVGLAFVGWYVLSRILMRELYLDYSFMMFSNLCCAYLLAFPFARGMRDGIKQTGLKTAAWVFVVGYGLIAWIGVMVALFGQDITLPVLGTKIDMDPYALRLEAGNHPNISAYMFLIALVCGVWLMGQTRRWWLRIPLPLCVAGAYAGIALTVSRTVMLQVSCFAAGIVFLAMLRLPIKAVWKKAIIGLLVGAICLVVVFVSFNWVIDGMTYLAHQMRAYAETVEPPVAQQRALMGDLATMKGRTEHYRGIMNLLREQPRILVTGLLNSEIVQTLLEYANCEHAHNSYLHTLVTAGIPGLLMALFFTVRAVWASMKLIFSSKAAFGNQLLAVILLVFLVCTIPESYLFTEYLTIANMPFFLVFGYVLEAERALRE